MQIQNTAGVFNVDELCGHIGATHPELVRESAELLADHFVEFRLFGDAEPPPPQVMLFTLARKVLGRDTAMYPQQVGDCVSFSAKNCTEYVQFLPILNGVRNVYKETDPPYLYGCGRVFVGGTVLGWSDGSCGSWQAAAVLKYGTIPTDVPNLPAYSGSRARQWGRSPGPPQEFVTAGQQHLVKSAALCKGIDDAIAAIKNGYPVSVCSNQGFNMTAGSDGYHHPSGHWSHGMAFIGVDTGEDGGKPCVCLLNNWGDVHGKIVDFRDPTMTWPVGTLRITLEAADGMLKAGDSYIYSMMDGFPAQPLPRDLFNVLG